MGDGAVIGVAPEGTRLGDIVCTFLESCLALVFRPTSATTSSPGDGSGYEVLQGGSFSLVGRAIIHLLGGEEQRRYKTVLSPDKTVEIVQAKGSFIKGRDAPWPVTVSMDMPTLWLVTRSEANLATRGFSKAMLDLLPREDSSAVLGRSKPADEERDSSGLTSTQKFDREVLMLQSDPQLRKHALGPGSAGIVNLGSTGYISSTLQTLYMLKPIRMDILNDITVRSASGIGAALNHLFKHLHSSSLPVSPLVLTRAFGWEDRKLGEAQDISEFFRKFTELFSSGKLGDRLRNTFDSLFCGKTERSVRDHGSSMIEQFYDLQANTRGLDTAEINTLEDSIRDYCATYEGVTVHLRTIPPVFLIHVKNFFYDIEKDNLAMVRTRFIYPRVLDLASIVDNGTENSPSELLYQLHGLATLCNLDNATYREDGLTSVSHLAEL
ncbi:uncharacterized protein C8A04DRAFT_31737 [Dichotomopilus funicola]|uniref:USP domain-containing protein n=1 Tax=Dichotomopilus funicola TaxID=1934379 RepID=A0AAN6UX20_9PEZI|nr:hypothetical protein C8A04DRAFT_31737 [Dichotomopilus funicola]